MLFEWRYYPERVYRVEKVERGDSKSTKPTKCGMRDEVAK